MINKAEISRLLKARKSSQAGLARALGMWESGLSDGLNGGRKFKAAELATMAEYLRISYEELLIILGVASAPPSAMLRVTGHIKADEVVALPPSGDADSLEEVSSPFPYGGKVLRVIGNEMAPRYRDGDLVAYNPGGVDFVGCVGHDAIVETEDGDCFLKVLQYGSGPGLYVLVSNNPATPPVINVRLRTACRIDWHRP